MERRLWRIFDQQVLDEAADPNRTSFSERTKWQIKAQNDSVYLLRDAYPNSPALNNLLGGSAYEPSDTWWDKALTGTATALVGGAVLGAAGAAAGGGAVAGSEGGALIGGGAGTIGSMSGAGASGATYGGNIPIPEIERTAQGYVAGPEGDIAAAAWEDPAVDYPVGPDLNVAWRDNPFLMTQQEVLEPYTAPNTWLDSLGDIYNVAWPTVSKLLGAYLGYKSASDQAPAPATGTPGSTLPIILQTGTGQQTGTTQPVFYQTPAPAAGSPNIMLYAVIAIAAYYFLR